MDNLEITLGAGSSIGWGTLALINAVLAQSKNRNGLVWFLGSIVGGPLATLILALVEKLPEQNKPDIEK